MNKRERQLLEELPVVFDIYVKGMFKRAYGTVKGYRNMKNLFIRNIKTRVYGVDMKGVGE